MDLDVLIFHSLNLRVSRDEIMIKLCYFIWDIYDTLFVEIQKKSDSFITTSLPSAFFSFQFI